MKNFINFIGFCCVFAFLNLQATVAYATIPSRSFSDVIHTLRPVGFLIGIISFSLLLIIMLLKQKSKKFDYQSAYQKFKAKDKVKITFVNENGEINTKCCRIASISSHKIVFETTKEMYECIPSEIQNIQKSSKISSTLKIIFFIGIVLFLIGNIPVMLKAWERLICPKGSFMGDDRQCHSCNTNDEIVVWHLKHSITNICPNRRFDSCHGTTFLPTSANDYRDCFF